MSSARKLSAFVPMNPWLSVLPGGRLLSRVLNYPRSQEGTKGVNKFLKAAKGAASGGSPGVRRWKISTERIAVRAAGQ